MKANSISEMERQDLIYQISEVHCAFTKAIENINVTAWTTKLDETQWSPAEVTEHTLLVERSLLQNVINHLGDTPTLEDRAEVEGKASLLRRYLLSAGKAQASEKNSTFLGLTKAEAILSLAQTQRDFEKLLSEHAQAPLHGITWRHGGFGLLTGYQWLIYIPLHSERHLNQLRGIAAR